MRECEFDGRSEGRLHELAGMIEDRPFPFIGVPMMRKLIGVGVIVMAWAAAASGQGLRLEGYDYPYPAKVFAFESQQQTLEMAYMDVAPAGAARGTVMLLHGKNFSGSYFGETIAALRTKGFRVIVPDQIGFGKSTKPAHYQFTFEQLALNTRALLDSLGVGPVQVLGHSMGGMLATRFALMFPERTASLTLLNPIGLEDWQQLGVPYTPIDTWYAQELAKTPAKIRAYQRKSYYDGKWREAYDPWVEQLASLNASPDYARMAWDQALTYDMIFTQPVVHEFGHLGMPVLLIIGQRDRTALGKPLVAEELRARLGNYPALGRAAFDRFIAPYTDFLLGHRAAK